MANLLRHLPPAPNFPEQLVKLIRQLDDLLAAGQTDAACRGLFQILQSVYPQPETPPDINATLYLADCLDHILNHRAVDTPQLESVPPNGEDGRPTTLLLNALPGDMDAALEDALSDAGHRVVRHQTPAGDPATLFEQAEQELNVVRGLGPSMLIVAAGLTDPLPAVLLHRRAAPRQVVVAEHEPCALPAVERVVTRFTPPEVWRARLAGRGIAVDAWSDAAALLAQLESPAPTPQQASPA